MMRRNGKLLALGAAVLFVGGVASAEGVYLKAYPNCGYEILGPNGCGEAAQPAPAPQPAAQPAPQPVAQPAPQPVAVKPVQTEPVYTAQPANTCAPVETSVEAQISVPPAQPCGVEVKTGPTPPPMKTILRKEERTIVAWGPEYKNKDPMTLLQEIRTLIKKFPAPKDAILNAPENCCYGMLVKPPVYKEVVIEYVKHDPKYQINVTPPKFEKAYKTVKVLVKPAYTEKVCTEPKYEPVVAKVKVATFTEKGNIVCKTAKEIPVTRMKLVEPPKCKIIKHPPVYATVKVPVEKLVQDATCDCKPGQPEIAKKVVTIKIQDPQVIWDAILCDVNLKPDEVKLIQQKLAELGYYNGPINGVLDDNTLAAVVKFQIDHDLPAGYISIQTLEKLGLHDLAKNYTACELQK
jgi:hypothetical protein